MMDLPMVGWTLVLLELATLVVLPHRCAGESPTRCCLPPDQWIVQGDSLQASALCQDHGHQRPQKGSYPTGTPLHAELVLSTEPQP